MSGTDITQSHRFFVVNFAIAMQEKHTAQEFETVKAAAIQDRTDLMRQISALTQQHKTKLAKTEQDLQVSLPRSR